MYLKMKKADFDLATGAMQGGSNVALKFATRVMKTNQQKLSGPDVLSMWVGARGSEPYIMLAVRGDHSARLSRTIPDSIEGVKVYYVEGSLA